MIVIGLTGNIGCGKSTVARMLRELGAAVIDADVVARQLRHNDAEVRSTIEHRFGTTDASALGRIVFHDQAALRDLEAILHPRVRDEVRARLAELEVGEVPVAVVEVIKLLESPLADRCDTIWVVRCATSDAVARLGASRGMTEAEARARLANQSSQAAKIAAADVVIDGSLPLEGTRAQVAAAYAALVTEPATEAPSPDAPNGGASD